MTSVFEPAGCSTLMHLLRARALERPGRTAYTFLRDGEVPESPLVYAALDAQACAIAGWLQAQGLAGERALLLFPPGLEFVAAFFGCVYAGVIAVPAYPPRVSRSDPRIDEIVADSQARVALTTSGVWSALEPRLGEAAALRSLRWLATDRLPAGEGDRWREPDVRPDTVAFLQYTSGSTRAPQGVMVSHGNVLHNLAALRRTMRHDEDSVSVSWLPHFHDMGLVWGILEPVYAGFPCFLMPPAAFLQRPVRWLQAVSASKATHSGGPNFAYDLCTSRVAPDQMAGLDLAAWAVAFNGAEPVRRATLERFARAFGPCGFRWEAHAPCYGLAEGTLMVSFDGSGTGPVLQPARSAALASDRPRPAGEGDGRTLVGCGRGEGVERLVIVDPHTGAPAAPGAEGEIWAAGPSIALGYWKRPEETARTFGAFLADGEGPFLRTGDLGFMTDGTLFVTGRIKDLVIVRGVNHYPQDIEQTVERSHTALRPAAGAAFSVEIDEEERLVVVQEVDRTQQRHAAMEEITGAIRGAVTEAHEIEPYAVVLIRHASILKTSSGKIQRRGCRTAFLDGTLAVVAEWRKPAAADAAPVAPAGSPRSESDVTGWLVERLSRESGIDQEEIDLAQPFASFGLDSARSLLLVGDLESWLGRRLNPVVLWNYPTVGGLARHLGE